MNYTENYQLPQWEKSDRIMMDDFNEGNRKIETALQEKSSVIIGAYVGNNAASRVIELGVKPKAVLLFDASGRTAVYNAFCGGLALPDCKVTGWTADGQKPTIFEVVNTGFKVYYRANTDSYTNSANSTGTTYYYIAFM